MPYSDRAQLAQMMGQQRPQMMQPQVMQQQPMQTAPISPQYQGGGGAMSPIMNAMMQRGMRGGAPNSAPGGPASQVRPQMPVQPGMNARYMGAPG